MNEFGKEIIFLDGAMGTILQAKGLDTLPEIWNITNPHTIEDIHKAYVSVGCNVLKANTFGANKLKLKDSGYTPQALIHAGIKTAKKAAGNEAKVAMDIGPTGKLLAPSGSLNFEEAIEIFAEMVCAGRDAGADYILIETMSDTYEIKAAMIAAKENSDLPIMVTFSPDENGRLLTGADILTAATLIESLGASAVGLNCGTGPSQMKGLLAKLCGVVQLPVIFNPNGGMPKVVDGNTVFDLTPAEYAAQMKDVVPLGASILGGCCGTTPQLIGEMITQIKGMQPTKTPVAKSTRISSFSQTVTLGKELIIIGERINPTGKPKLKQALKNNDMSYLCNEALTQTAEGAKLLDVNVGLPGIDEEKMLPAAVFAIQSVTSTPLVIDTSDPKAAEAALRIYNGKPLLNSINGKAESMEKMLPIAKKYGAAIIALALDNEIPETSEGRVKVAEKIVSAAKSHGIPQSDIVVDALTMTMSTNSQNANITLDAVEYIHNTLGICTVLGLSNISFGLPMREYLNAGFLTMAANKGLSAAIANPANAAIMDALYVQQVLSGHDENCAKYIEKFSARQAEVKPIASNPSNFDQQGKTLYNAVIKGLKEEAKKSAESLLTQTSSTEIIDTQLIPALDNVGKSFGEGKTFLPQLLMSANAAQSAFGAIRKHMQTSGTISEKQGKIVLATVKGDIHDIGKNIVKTLLENYNFHVIDLGKDVHAEQIVQTALDENAQLVGLSALMTTTVSNMEETIHKLHEKVPHCKIMVGGAVLTESYAKKIGADFYAPDAMGAVRFAQELQFGKWK